MNRNAEYYKKLFQLEQVKCNGFLKLAYEESPHFNFAYYMLEEGMICPWHKMGTLETCHYIAGDPMEIYIMEKKGEKTILHKELLHAGNLHYFIKPEKWCTFFLPSGSEWSLISHFHFPAYDENQTQYATPAEFTQLFPQHSQLAKKYGLKEFYNKNSNIE